VTFMDAQRSMLLVIGQASADSAREGDWGATGGTPAVTIPRWRNELLGQNFRPCGDVWSSAAILH